MTSSLPPRAGRRCHNVLNPLHFAHYFSPDLGTELAALAAAVQARDEALDRDGVKRQVAGIVGWSRYTAALDKLLESVIPREG